MEKGKHRTSLSGEAKAGIAITITSAILAAGVLMILLGEDDTTCVDIGIALFWIGAISCFFSYCCYPSRSKSDNNSKTAPQSAPQKMVTASTTKPVAVKTDAEVKEIVSKTVVEKHYPDFYDSKPTDDDGSNELQMNG